MKIVEGIPKVTVPIVGTSNGELIEEFESIIAAAKKMGVKRNAIDCVLQGRHKTSCGSFWKYLD